MRPHVSACGRCCLREITCVDNLLLETFLLADRSGRGDSKGGVVGRKQCHREIFSTAKVT